MHAMHAVFVLGSRDLIVTLPSVGADKSSPYLIMTIHLATLSVLVVTWSVKTLSTNALP